MHFHDSRQTVGSVLTQTRYKRDPRQMDEDEEAWFDEEEDEFIPFNKTPSTSPLSITTPPPFSSAFASMLSSIASSDAVTSTTSFPSRSSAPLSLGSYSPRPAAATSTSLMRSRLQQIVAESKSMPTVSAVSEGSKCSVGSRCKVWVKFNKVRVWKVR